MGTFVRHTSCSKCGSRDNAAEYDDGGTYCFSCAQFLIDKHDGEGAAKAETGSKFYKLPELSPVDLTARGFNQLKLSQYKIGADDKNEWVYFPCYRNGKVVGAKKRRQENWEDKDYRWEGDGSVGIFGMQTVSEKHTSIIITEGEFDAIAASLMYGLKHACVSITHGAGGAANDLKREIDFINKFEKVYLCFDSDSVGQEAVEKCLPLLKAGKARVVTLPDGFKDANDMLKAGADYEFREAVNAAQEVLPPEFTPKQELFDKVVAHIKQTGLRSKHTTGFKGLDAIIGGFNPGELITVAAYTGVGKTTLAMQLALNAMESGLKVLLFTLETTQEDIVCKLLEMKSKARVYSDRTPTTIPDHLYLEDLKWIVDRLTVYNHMGIITQEKIQNNMEYAAMAGLADCVVIDHITAATQCLDGKQVQVIDSMMDMLNRVTTQQKLWTLAITHVSRNNNDTRRHNVSLNGIRNSEGIAHYSHCVLGMIRDMDSNVVQITVLKGHRKYGHAEGFLLGWSTDDLCYYELKDKHDSISRPEETEGESGAQGESSESEDTAIEQIQSETVSVEGREDKLQVELREGSTSEPPFSYIRGNAPHLHTDVSTRLHAFYEDRKDYLCGDERVFTPRRQVEARGGEEAESYGVLEAVIHECFPAPQTRLSTWFGLRRVG